MKNFLKLKKNSKIMIKRKRKNERKKWKNMVSLFYMYAMKKFLACLYQSTGANVVTLTLASVLALKLA